MNKRRVLTTVGVVVVALLAAAAGWAYAQGPGAPPADPSGPAAPVDTAFTYQGRLEDASGPVNDTCSMAFRLYSQQGGGVQLGTAITQAVPVVDGLFTTLLNDANEFGAMAFAGDERWLGIHVKCTGDVDYTDLGRQELTAVPYAHYALNADKLDGQEGTAYQDRVTGFCSPGRSIRVINSDGSVACQPDAPLNRVLAPSDNISTTVDNSGNVGTDSSLTIGDDGLGLISYHDSSTFPMSLKVAHCSDLACTSVTSTTVDGGANSVGGDYTSIAIGADGRGLISYYDFTNQNLKVAHCSDLACASVTSTTVDIGGNGGADFVGRYSSIAIGTDGLGLISYLDETNTALKVAHCEDPDCSSVISSTVDTGGSDSVGWLSSLTIGADGLGLISYFNYSKLAIRVAHCQDLACTAVVTTTIDAGSINTESAITTGADGLGLISYQDAGTFPATLKVAHCENLACTTFVTTTIDNAASVGRYSSITIGADGLGLISYYDDTSDALKIAHCSNLACTSATHTTVDVGGNGGADLVGWYTAVTIGADGLPLISYWDVTNSALKVAHCSNPFCLPYFRRR